jgi:cytochrome P450
MAVFTPKDNMHGLLREIRSQTQIIEDPNLPAPMVLNHEDVRKYIASKEARCQEGELLTLTGITNEHIHDFWREIMFSKNGSEQRRLRQLIHKYFTVPAVAPERTTLKAKAEVLINSLPKGEPFDLVSTFIEPMVGFGISNHAGFDEIDHPRVMSWGRVVTNIFVGLDAADQDTAGDQFKAMFDHLDEVNAARRSTPQDKVIDHLIAAHNDGKMSYKELRAMMGNIVTGGYGTTQHALVWLTWYLMNLPETLAQVRADPTLIEAARKEILRMEPPVEGTFRTAETDLTAGGCPFNKGETFMVSIMSSNRDESLFTEPDTFRLDRDNLHLLSYGAGPHRCLGASLANAIVEEAATVLLDSALDLQLVDSISDWSPADGFRERDKLIVQIG